MLDIKNQDLEILKKILSQHFPSSDVWAFGSRVSGKAKKYSDIDLVLKNKIKQKITLNELEQAKEDFMESDISIRVDLLDWNSMDKKFKNIIKKNHFVLKTSK